MLCWAVNITLGPGFFRQNTSASGLSVLTSEYSPEGFIDSQAQHAMIKTQYSMPLHWDTATVVFKLLVKVEWKSRYQL